MRRMGRIRRREIFVRDTKAVDVAATVCQSLPQMKRRSKRITVRLPDPTAAKLERIARKVTPKGTEPNTAAAIRNLIEKEKL